MLGTVRGRAKEGGGEGRSEGPRGRRVERVLLESLLWGSKGEEKEGGERARVAGGRKYEFSLTKPAEGETETLEKETFFVCYIDAVVKMTETQIQTNHFGQ